MPTTLMNANIIPAWRSNAGGVFSGGLMQGLAAVYSPDKLVSNWNGPTVRIRRDSDSAESDFTSRQLYDGTADTWLQSGGVNMFTFSNDINNGSWAKQEILSVTGGFSDPFGGSTAQLVVPAASSSSEKQYRRSILTVGETDYYLSGYFKYSGSGNFRFVALKTIFGGTNVTWFDIENGTIGTTASAHTASISSVGGGWYRCSIRFSFSGVPASNSWMFDLCTSNGLVLSSGDGTNGVLVYGMQLEAGALRAYSNKTTTAQNGNGYLVTLYDQHPVVVGTPRLYLDGVNDYGSFSTAFTFAGDFTATATVELFNNTTAKPLGLWTGTTAAHAIYLEGANWNFRVNSTDCIIAGSVLQPGVYTITVSRTGSTAEVIVNGVSVGTGTCSTSTFTLARFGYTVHNTYYTEGSMYNLNIDSVYATTGVGNLPSGWIDTIGSRTVTFAGTPGQYYPETASKHAWFDGLGTLVILGSEIALTGDFTVSFDLFTAVATTDMVDSNLGGILQGATTSDRVMWSSTTATTVIVNNATYTLNGGAISAGIHTIEFTRTGSTFRMFVDGVQYGADQTITDPFKIQRFGREQGGRGIVGSMWNININNQHAYSGNGPATGHWRDTIGSNHPSTVSLSTFAYRTDGTVVPQTDMTQTTVARQFQIGSGGVILKDAGKVFFVGRNVPGNDADSRYFETRNFGFNTGPMSLIAVGKRYTADAFQQIVSMNQYNNPFPDGNNAGQSLTVGNATGATSDDMAQHYSWNDSIMITNIDLGLTEQYKRVLAINRRSGGTSGQNSNHSLRARTKVLGLLTSTGSQTNANRPTKFGRGAMTIGMQGSTASVRSWTGPIHAVAAYNRPLLDAECVAIEAKLGKVYDVI